MKLALLVFVAACHPAEVPNWQPDAGACEAYIVPSGTNLMAPAVTFSADILPVLSHSCASASCHGIADNAQGGLFLGATSGAAASDVYPHLVGPIAGQLNSMPLVSPGDPVHSYLMHKLDADQCTLASECVNSDCMHAMPFDGQLDAETRDLVRRWIAQGAQNN